MGSLVAVAVHPVLGHASNLIQCIEDIAVENHCAAGAVKAFDVSILRQFSRLPESGARRFISVVCIQLKYR